MQIGIDQFIQPTAESRRRVQEQRAFTLPSPMLAKAGSRADLQRPDMIAETKWDGTRVMLVKNGNNVRLFVARGTHNEYTHKYPKVVADAKKLEADNCILDGEFVFFDKRGNDVFLTINATDELRRGKKIKYMAFDILQLNGQSTRNKPLGERKRILDRVIPDSLTIIKETEVVRANKARFYDQQIKKDREGVMLKGANSIYVGARSSEWIKVKRTHTLDVVVRGATEGQGARASYFGALHCYYPVNGRMKHIGDVGSGFNTADLIRIRQLLDGGQEFVIEVKFQSRTQYGIMRFPRFVRLRLDKTPAEVMRG